MWDERTARTARGRARLLGLGLLPLAYLAANFACSSDDHPQNIGNEAELQHASLDAGTEPTDNPGEHVDAGGEPSGDAGVEPVASDAAAPDGPTEPPTCGNALIDPDEDCDPALPATETCVLRGFDTGTLGCTAACRFDTSTCSGTENCYDDRDNDGDGSVDCGDADCAMPCVDACLAPPVLDENSVLYGTTRGHGSSLASSCSAVAPSGREVVYQVNVSADAKLDVLLSSNQALNVSLRTSCEDDASELACGRQTRLTRSALAGETYFIVVDGTTSEDLGDYVLAVQTRQQACGDGIRDTSEECDDGNINDGDGCDPDCNLEASEFEPNGSLGQADSYDAGPWFAQIGAEGDEDYCAVTLTSQRSTLVVSTQNLGDGACGYNLMDTVVDVFDTDAQGNVLRGSDDDSGDGKCSQLIVPGLRSGTYYVRVKAADGAAPATFPYRLDVAIAPCGDAEVSFGEECDDGNLTSGDGCDDRCQVELP